jgi:hypothetical protein
VIICLVTISTKCVGAASSCFPADIEHSAELESDQQVFSGVTEASKRVGSCTTILLSSAPKSFGSFDYFIFYTLDPRWGTN